MKNLTTLLFIFITLITFSQTIVSTDIENKNVILEEFTGIHCGYCPQGHVIAQGIINNNPGDAFVINIHTGSYSTPSGSEPDFRTAFGSSIANQSGLVGYPAGTVNRHLFSGLSQGSGTAMSRGSWVNASNQILAQQSYVNIAVNATINLSTRELTAHIEAYYTGDSPESSNFLNLALLQDSTYGYQASGGSNYNHMHRLVNLITGQWGEEILETSTGSFIDRTYTYTIPIDYNDILVDLKHMKLIAFISETQQEILTGIGVYPTYIGNVTQNDVSVERVQIPDEVCETSMSPIVTIRNTGQTNLTSLVFNYSVNGGNVETYNWTGNLDFGQSENVTLNEISYTLLENNTLSITTELPNNVSDDNTENNTIEKNFTEAFHTTTKVNMDLVPGAWGFEITWELLDPAGIPIFSGQGSDGDNQETFVLDLNSCYVFNLYDSYGNGFKPGGYLRLTGTDGVDIRYIDGDFGSLEIIPFKAASLSSIDKIKNDFKIYPNPAYNSFSVNNPHDIIQNIIISDISGKIVYNKKFKNISNLIVNTESFNSGMYFVNIYTDKDVITKKISVIK